MRLAVFEKANSRGHERKSHGKAFDKGRKNGSICYLLSVSSVFYQLLITTLPDNIENSLRDLKGNFKATTKASVELNDN